MVRKHGWQLPAHTFQVVAITVFCLLVVAFYAFFAPFLGGHIWEYVLITVYSPVDKVSSRAGNLDRNYNAPTVQGMVQLNLMVAPTHNNFNAYQPTIPRLGQLNPLPSGQDTFYTPGMPCVEHMNFFGPSTSFYGVRDDPNFRPPHLPHDASPRPH